MESINNHAFISTNVKNKTDDEQTERKDTLPSYRKSFFDFASSSEAFMATTFMIGVLATAIFKKLIS